MYNYLIILFIFILLILLISYVSSKKSFKVSSNWEVSLQNKESFENNNTIRNLNIDYNLIQNNCFENKKNIDNYINQEGYNKIINFQNPGKSEFVLNQKNKSFYEISCDSSVNSTYLLYFYIYLENMNMNEFNFESFVKIRMATEDYSNYLPKIKYNVIKKVDLGNNKNWYYVKVTYNSNENVLDKQIITFNNQQKNCILYITKISLFKVLDNAPNFIYNKDLICFIDSLNYYSNNNILHDLSGNNNDLYLSNIPKKNEDYIFLANTKIEGFPSNKLNSNKFTLLFTINKQDENSEANSKITTNINKNNILLSIQGNNDYAFEISILNDYLYLLQNNKKIKSNKPLNYFNKSIITIIYDGNILNIYNDNLNILSHKINTIYLNKNPIIINKNKNLDVYLYNILAYNRIVNTNELKSIRDYFITNQNKNVDKNPNTSGFLFDDIYDKKNSFNNPLIGNYDKNIEKFASSEENAISNEENTISNEENTISNEENTVSYEETHDNINNQMKFSCIKDCDNLCKKFLNGTEKSINNYKKCLKNCKNVFNSCNKYCKDEKNSNNSIYCKDTCYVEKNKDTCDIEKNNICPKVYKKNGKYVVYIPENGMYSDFFTGEKIFSADIDKARNMYAYNFPNCIIPKELIHNNNKYKEFCPYTVNELNPCNARVCDNVNWNVSNYKDLNLNDKCKKVISNYCHINYDKDENCLCWDPKYKNTKKCIEFRKYFENPNDYCNISSFNIEQHPDFNKYIKKDKIPCWGCNIPE